MHPLIQSVLDDCQKIPLATSRAFRPLVQCRLCKTSIDGGTLNGYCPECYTKDYTCEGCGGVVHLDEPCGRCS